MQKINEAHQKLICSCEPETLRAPAGHRLEASAQVLTHQHFLPDPSSPPWWAP